MKKRITMLEIYDPREIIIFRKALSHLNYDVFVNKIKSLTIEEKKILKDLLDSILSLEYQVEEMEDYKNIETCTNENERKNEVKS